MGIVNAALLWLRVIYKAVWQIASKSKWRDSGAELMATRLSFRNHNHSLVLPYRDSVTFPRLLQSKVLPQPCWSCEHLTQICHHHTVSQLSQGLIRFLDIHRNAFFFSHSLSLSLSPLSLSLFLSLNPGGCRCRWGLQCEHRMDRGFEPSHGRCRVPCCV